jgi:vacuolar-type H+-ATPase subunit F/Vma7
MSKIVFIGDELTAAGFRLTGIETVLPSPDAASGALAQARTRAQFVLLTADCARNIPINQLEDALLAETPIVAIIPDILMQTPPPDLARRLRAVLGIES